MKTYLLLATCLILVGCRVSEEDHRAVLAKLDAIDSKLAARRADAVRWAFANKREIDSAIFQRSRDKMEEVKKTESLSPEIEEKIRQYEALQSALTRKQMEAMTRRFRLPQRAGIPETPMPDEDYGDLSNRVAEAKAPIADVIDRRSRQAAQYRDQFSTGRLIAEYAKDRFDLVVDSSDEHFSHPAVLYRTNLEVLDITDGIINLFKEKAKQ
jgi:hypothetical protein